MSDATRIDNQFRSSHFVLFIFVHLNYPNHSRFRSTSIKSDNPTQQYKTLSDVHSIERQHTVALDTPSPSCDITTSRAIRYCSSEAGNARVVAAPAVKQLHHSSGALADLGWMV